MSNAMTPAPSEARRADRFTLAPMTIADLLDVTFDLIKSNWRAVVGLSLVLAAPLAVATFSLNLIFSANAGSVTGSVFDAFSAGSLEAGLISAFVSVLISIIVVPLVTGSITRIVAGDYLGRKFTATAALRSMLPHWLGLMLVVLIARLAAIPGAFAVLVGAAVVQAIFWAVVPVIAVEEVGPLAAIKRTWKLMTPRLFHYTVAALVVQVVAQLLSWIVSYPATIAALVLADQVVLSSSLQGLAIVFSTMATTPFAAVIATLVYFDARVRVEGFDVAVMASRLPRPTREPGQSTL